MMTATAMRVMMTITTMNDGSGDSDDFFWLELVDARLSPARGTHAARSETPVHEAKRTQAEPNNLLPRQAITLSPTMTNAPEAAPVLTFALPGGTPLSPRPACASTLLRGNFRPGRPPDRWSART